MKMLLIYRAIAAGYLAPRKAVAAILNVVKKIIWCVSETELKPGRCFFSDTQTLHGVIY